MLIIDFRVTVPQAEHATPSGPESDYLANYGRVYTHERGGAAAAASLVARMQAAGVERAVLQAEWGYGDYRALNDAVARIVRQYPDRLIGYCTVNPAAEDDLAAVVEHEVRERGMAGVNLQPFSYRVRANDRRFYPLYERCQQLGVPVTIHTSVNFSGDRSIEYGRPLHLCDVACDFPNLRIVANHGGWPWVTEMVAVAWKHPNVYIEFGAVSPKYLARPGTGWEPLLVYGNSLLQDRVLFATDCMIPFDRAVQEALQLPLKPEVLEKWMGGNAASVLGLTQRSKPAPNEAPAP